MHVTYRGHNVFVEEGNLVIYFKMVSMRVPLKVNHSEEEVHRIKLAENIFPIALIFDI